MAIQKISESLYVGLCLKVGTPQQIANRRDELEIKELLEAKAWRPGQDIVMYSGSKKEGFEFKDSDVDLMFWDDDNRVIWDFTQYQFYNSNSHTVILSDIADSPPGFTLLSLPMRKASPLILRACVCKQDVLLVSSAKFRIYMCRAPGFKTHGPCKSGRVINQDYDHAHCLKSDFWPPIASSWISRCHAWPSPRVVDKIVRSGCHVVPIGHKYGNKVDNEWRISFSKAETQLVFYMNQTQLLAYGLLKLFLTELINKGLDEEEKLLCSYHIKTAVFWAIQQNTSFAWCPSNLLAGFWVCFKVILKWVYEGFCPNFFIPENNIFLNKVFGHAQAILFARLWSLYEKGFAFLLQIPSVGHCITSVLCNPRISFCTDDHSLISEAKFDMIFFENIFDSVTIDILNNWENCMIYLHAAEQLIWCLVKPCQIIILQNHMKNVLQTSAFILHDSNTSGANKHIYITDKISCYMLKLAAKFGCASDMLYLAMYYYRTLRYSEALSVIALAKDRLGHAQHMCDCIGHQQRYMNALGGMSWSTKLKYILKKNLILINYISYVNELTLEQQISLKQKKYVSMLPVFVVLYMLEFLCYRHVNLSKAQSALDDLDVLVHYDNGSLVLPDFRDLSREILGICQQMTRNNRTALYSYQKALEQQSPIHKLKPATEKRIRDLHLT